MRSYVRQVVDVVLRVKQNAEIAGSTPSTFNRDFISGKAPSKQGDVAYLKVSRLESRLVFARAAPGETPCSDHERAA